MPKKNIKPSNPNGNIANSNSTELMKKLISLAFSEKFASIKHLTINF